jgi:hypothetical protein
METVNLSFRYSENDYVQAMRAHYASRMRLPLDVPVLAGVAAFGVYEVHSGSQGVGILLLALSGVFALMLVAVFVIVPRIVFRSQPKLRDTYSLIFSPEGIRFQTAHINSELQWSMYTRALEGKHSFILYYGSQQFSVIPKRAFQDVAQRRTFERLLAQNVKTDMPCRP